MTDTIDKHSRVSYTTFTSSANSDNQEDTCWETGGGNFFIEEVIFAIESGAGSNVSVQLSAGGQLIVPDDSPFDIAGEAIPIKVDKNIPQGVEIKAVHDNQSGTDRDVTVIISGFESTDLPV